MFKFLLKSMLDIGFIYFENKLFLEIRLQLKKTSLSIFVHAIFLLYFVLYCFAVKEFCSDF